MWSNTMRNKKKNNVRRVEPCSFIAFVRIKQAWETPVR